jgi:hypothetical protein
MRRTQPSRPRNEIARSIDRNLSPTITDRSLIHFGLDERLRPANWCGRIAAPDAVDRFVRRRIVRESSSEREINRYFSVSY